MKEEHLASSNSSSPEEELHKFTGFTYDTVIQKYNELAEKYEPALSALDFPDPEMCAQQIERIAENKWVEILDVGAGTGFVGENLVKLGFRNVTAIDGSASMLEIARKKNVYLALHEVFLGLQGNLPAQFHGKYDFVTASAVFAEGHVRDDAFDDILLALKKGGHAIFTIAEDHLPDYENKINMLVEQKSWSLVSRKTYKKFTKIVGEKGMVKPRIAFMFIFVRL
jgi:predicted TPR repeat methyltransferase